MRCSCVLTVLLQVLWLDKGSFSSNWRVRWFTVREGFMRLYASEDHVGHKQPEQLLALVDYEVVTARFAAQTEIEGKQHSLQLKPRRDGVDAKTVFTFCFEDQQALSRWSTRLVARQVLALVSCWQVDSVRVCVVLG